MVDFALEYIAYSSPWGINIYFFWLVSFFVRPALLIALSIPLHRLIRYCIPTGKTPRIWIYLE